MDPPGSQAANGGARHPAQGERGGSPSSSQRAIKAMPSEGSATQHSVWPESYTR